LSTTKKKGSDAMTSRRNYLVWLVLGGVAVLFFAPLGLRSLWDSDEGRYAEIAREMLALGDWVTPHLDYVVYFEKPPLMYWLTALSMRLFGAGEWAARFWCAAFGLLTVMLTYRIGRDWKGQRVGILAAILLAVSFGFFAMTQFLMLDMALTFWTTLAVLAGIRLSTRGPAALRPWGYLMAFALAGGVLTKGLVGLVLPTAAVGFSMLAHRRWEALKALPWASATILFFALAAPWFVLVSVRNPVFPYFFFVHEHVLRYTTGIHHRGEPIWFFFPVLLLAGLPWSLFLARVVRTWGRHRLAGLRADPAATVLVSWSALVFVFFSLSHSKLVGYILPIFPTLAVLAAHECEQALESPAPPAWFRRIVGIQTLVYALLFLPVLLLDIPNAAARIADRVDPLVRPLLFHLAGKTSLVALALGIGIAALGASLLLRQGRAHFYALVFAQALLLASLSVTAPSLDPFLSARGLARKIRAEVKENDKVVAYLVSYENSLQTLAFYLGRRIAILGRYGELSLGEQQASDSASWFAPKEKATEALLSMPAGTWAITDERTMGSLARYGDLFMLAGREGWLVAFKKLK